MGSWAERTYGKMAAGGQGWTRWQLAEQAVLYLHVHKLGGTTGEQDRPAIQGSSTGK